MINNDNEFFQLAGQISRYIINQGEGSKKSHDVIKIFLNTRDIKSLKEKIINMYKLYSHAFRLNHRKFEENLTYIMNYDSEAKTKDYQNIFLRGFLEDNMFYKKLE